MATIKQPLENEVIGKRPVKDLRKDYKTLADDMRKLLDRNYIYCHGCDSFKNKISFYSDKRNESGYFYLCKDCVLKQVEQRKNNRDIPNETEESVQQMLHLMDKPYFDSVYQKTKAGVAANTGERTKHSVFASYITQISSLPQYAGKTWNNSEFGFNKLTEEEIWKDTKKNAKILEKAKEHFGVNAGYTHEELVWLENQYQDWISRYPCDSKSQEVLFKRLCCQELEINKTQKSGRSTKDLDAAFQSTMSSLGIKPSQSNLDGLADTLTFGQLIDKWEQEKPIPEPDEDFKDVDKIGLYLDVFFKGHLSKMMGLRNAASALYDKFMKKYTVEKPDLDDEEEEALFNQIFGSAADELEG